MEREELNKILKDFLKLQDYSLDDEIQEIANRLREFSPYQVFWIINSLIMDNTKYAFQNRDKSVSPKMAYRLFYLYKGNSCTLNNKNTKIDLQEVEWLREKLMRIYDYYSESQFDQVKIEPQTESLINFIPQNFINYHFDYPDTSWFQYLHAIEINSQIINQIYKKDNLKADEIEKGLLICILYDFIYHDFYSNKIKDFLCKQSKYKFEGFLTSFSIREFSKILEDNQINSEKFINKFFPEVTHQTDLKPCYPTDKYYKEKFSLGLRYKKRIFFPRSNFVLDEFWNYILEQDDMMGKKDDFTEKYTKLLLIDFFGEENVYSNIYDEFGNEQDLIVVQKDYILSFECKSEILKEPFRDFDKSDKRMRHNFNRVIQKSYEQALRVKLNIKTKKGKYYNSDKKDVREERLDLNKYDYTKVIMVCVTLNNYLNLSNRVNNYIDLKGEKEYPWVVDIFSLEHIFKKTLHMNKKEDFFIKYILDRVKTYESIQALGAEELECFGYYIKYEKFQDSLNGSVTLNLGNGYATFVLDYIPQPEILLMYDYFLRLRKLS